MQVLSQVFCIVSAFNPSWKKLCYVIVEGQKVEYLAYINLGMREVKPSKVK